jgi:hypothetical protein
MVFFFALTAGAGDGRLLSFAHLALCAAAIFLLAAALMVRVFFGATVDLPGPAKIPRSSLLRSSICSLIAAARLSWLIESWSKFMRPSKHAKPMKIKLAEFPRIADKRTVIRRGRRLFISSGIEGVSSQRPQPKSAWTVRFSAEYNAYMVRRPVIDERDRRAAWLQCPIEINRRYSSRNPLGILNGDFVTR